VGKGRNPWRKIRLEIGEQLVAHVDVVRSERKKITGAVASYEKLLQRLVAHRIVLTVILTYVVGLLTMPVLQELVSFLGSMLH
jgi:hypothetical protein